MKSSQITGTDSVLMDYETSPVNRKRRSGTELANLLEAIKIVLAEYDEGITIRHLFYRLESAKVIEKTESAYKNLCSHLSKWRKQGDLAFDSFVDGTRWHYGATTYSDADEAMQNAVRQYRKNLWQAQDVYMEIWVEKDAIASVVNPIASSWGLKLFPSRGFASISSLYSAARTFQGQVHRGKATVILYLGDHDPSGLAIDTSIVQAWHDFGMQAPVFTRVAILPQHIEEFNLPTRPVKKTDGRAKNWKGGCVEIDTLTPQQMRELLEAHIKGFIDAEQWERTKEIEKAERETLRAASFFLKREAGK